MIESLQIKPENVFEHTAVEYNRYSREGEVYHVSEGAIVEKLSPLLKKDKTIRVLEVGAGTGQSAKRISDALKETSDTFQLTLTEPNHSMAQQSREIEDAIPVPEENEVGVEDLSSIVERGSMDAVYGSQTIHWWDDPQKGLEEIYDTLKPEGRLVLTSGQFLSLDEEHDNASFRKHPVYQEFLNNVKVELVAQDLWNDEDPFTITDNDNKPNDPVNQFFRRRSPEEIIQMMNSTGYEGTTLDYIGLKFNRREQMERLMSPAVSDMLIFSGTKTSRINPKIREEVVEKARKSTMENKESSDLLRKLDGKQESGVIDTIVIFTSDKPKS